MQKNQIILDFGEFTLEAELFNTSIAERFAQHLPYTFPLVQWGGELYGSIGIDLGEENPVPTIPPGGIAYTNRGSYLCVFFGQMPAWAVEYVGQIKNESWKKLLEDLPINRLTVQLHPTT